MRWGWKEAACERTTPQMSTSIPPPFLISVSSSVSEMVKMAVLFLLANKLLKKSRSIVVLSITLTGSSFKWYSILWNCQFSVRPVIPSKNCINRRKVKGIYTLKNKTYSNECLAKSFDFVTWWKKHSQVDKISCSSNYFLKGTSTFMYLVIL